MEAPNNNNNSNGNNYANKSIGEPIYDLPQHIKFLSVPLEGSNGELNGFDVEFKFIERRCEKPDFAKSYDAADRPENKVKNRWTNVLPPDETRVELCTINNTEGTDYINANYISGEIEGSENQYISTQGPLPNTICDFWRMIWEQNSKVVVMLTKEIEGGRVKCVKYWPDKDSRMYDDIKVGIENVDNSTKELTVRTLMLERAGQRDKRKVMHYQYKEWPDHGLPASTKVFLKLVHSVKKNEGDGPIVVHCSAGIGRSGTFCAVHSIVQYMQHYVNENGKMPPINIVETVLNLRDQRPGMVQTKEQFMFCYLAVQEEFLRILGQLKSNGKITDE